jgi:hypothetical protein
MDTTNINDNIKTIKSMKTIKLFLLSALMLFSGAGLHAQITIGGLEEPHKGAVLDLNSTLKGGLLLSNVVLDNLYTIPADFPGMTPPPADAEDRFTGAIVYHTGTNNIPAGVYTWNGTNWTSIKENCTPLDAANLKVTPEIAFAKTGDPVTFSVSSGAGSRCAEGETYEWFVDNASASAAFTYPALTWTTPFAVAGDYKVKVKATSLYSDPSSKISSNEATVYVTADGGPTPAMLTDTYGIVGETCLDVKKTGQGNTAVYADRKDGFPENNYTKTYKFHHGNGYRYLHLSGKNS